MLWGPLQNYVQSQSVSAKFISEDLKEQWTKSKNENDLREFLNSRNPRFCVKQYRKGRRSQKHFRL